jgi:tRNA modification GTPase
VDHTSDENSAHSEREPIAALSTGTGASAVAVIRLSGSRIFELLSPLVQVVSSKHKSLADWPKRQLILCSFKDQTGLVLDEPLIVLFKGPYSFTGQDCAEIQCHGGPYIVSKILGELYRNGFRPAEPGEFTRRAFLNGKLDLTRAEGIRKLVEAQSHQQWLAARQLATGKLATVIEELRAKLIEAMAYLEAQIDFPDEGDTASLHLGEVRSRVDHVRRMVKKLAATYSSGKVASHGLTVVLFGPPNAGKSTLMNELLGRDRAIVTPIAGTTRDYLEESCLISGRLIRLIDMAGVRDVSTSHDTVEKLGIEKALSLAKKADLVLFLASAEMSSSEVALLEKELSTLSPRDSLKIATKVDLKSPSWSKNYPQVCQISCKSGLGLKALKDLLVAKVDGHVRDLKEETFVTSARHMHALEETLRALEQFYVADSKNAFEEILAFELQVAAKSLRSIIGEVGSDDVLDKIFSQFCIGK